MSRSFRMLAGHGRSCPASTPSTNSSQRCGGTRAAPALSSCLYSERSSVALDRRLEDPHLLDCLLQFGTFLPVQDRTVQVYRTNSPTVLPYRSTYSTARVVRHSTRYGPSTTRTRYKIRSIRTYVTPHASVDLLTDCAMSRRN